MNVPGQRISNLEQQQDIDSGAPAGFFCRGCKAGDHNSNIFFCYVWMPCCIPDPTVIEKVDFRLHCYVT